MEAYAGDDTSKQTSVKCSTIGEGLIKFGKVSEQLGATLVLCVNSLGPIVDISGMVSP